MAIALDRGTIEWEAARVACAFGVKEIFPTKVHYNHINGYEGVNAADFTIHWQITMDSEPPYLNYIALGKRSFTADAWLLDTDWQAAWDTDEEGQLLARGLYRLGFDDESVLQQLPSLSAHERLELRMSLPKEFWPGKWLDEADRS